MVQPAKGTLDYPAARQPHKLSGLLGAPHHRQAAPNSVRDPVHQSPAVAAIHPNLSPLLTTARQAAQQQAGTIAVLHTGGSHHDYPQQPQRVHQEVTLAPVDLLPGIVTPPPWNRRAFGALAVQAARGRVLVAPALLPQSGAQSVMEALPSPITGPTVERVVNRAPGRELAGQLPPLTTRLQDIQDRIHDLA